MIHHSAASAKATVSKGTMSPRTEPPGVTETGAGTGSTATAALAFSKTSRGRRTAGRYFFWFTEISNGFGHGVVTQGGVTRK